MQSIGPYTLVSRLGRGGMAEVWKGVRRTSIAGAEKVVAVKVIASQSLDDPQFQAMFLREARVSMLLNHSTIAQVFDVGVEDGRLYMVMEYVDGLNVSELLKIRAGRPLSIQAAAYITGEVLRALVYAHDFEKDGEAITIIHRDISPQNIMISKSGEVKVADFGIASISIEETSSTSAKGKLRYMPPEQLMGESRQPTVDIFALGAVLFELLEGKAFRETADVRQLYTTILSGQTPKLSGNGLPAQVRMLCERMLEPAPENRIQSAHEALESLYAWPGYRNAALELGSIVKQARRASQRATSRDAASLEARADVSTGRAAIPQAAPASTSSITRTEVLDDGAIDGPTVVEDPSFATARSSARQLLENKRLTLLLLLTLASVASLSLALVSFLSARNSSTEDTEPANGAQTPAAASSEPGRLDSRAPTHKAPRTPDDGTGQSETTQPAVIAAPVNEKQPQPTPGQVSTEQREGNAVQEDSMRTNEGVSDSAGKHPRSSKRVTKIDSEPTPQSKDIPPATTPKTAALLVTRGNYDCAALSIKERSTKKGVMTVILSDNSESNITLPPGDYSVSIQHDCGENWINAGLFTVDAGKKYKLEARRPPSIEFRER